MNEFTLPVWVVAAAKSATNVLVGNKFKDTEITISKDNDKKLFSNEYITIARRHGLGELIGYHYALWKF